jgi:hypothetical protein
MGKLNMLRRYTLRWFIIPMRQIVEHLASTHLRDHRIHMEVTSKANLIYSMCPCTLLHHKLLPLHHLVHHELLPLLFALVPHGRCR